MPRLMGQRVILCLATLVVGAVFLLPALPAALSGSSYIVIHLALTGLMFALWRAEDVDMKMVLMAGLCLRVILIPAPIFSSNDSERYLWDGAVVLAGLDPYITAPNMAEAADLRTLWPTPEEHSAYPTLYPPGALALFALSALAGPVKGVWLWKALVSLAGLLSLLIGYDLLKRRGMLRHLPLLALSPLLLLETGVGAHLDAFCVLAVVAALALCDREKFVLAGLIIGWSASLKFLPAVMAGPLIFYLRPKAALRLFLSSLTGFISIYVLAIASGFQAIGILPVFFEKWRNGAPFYNALEYALSPESLIWVIGIIAISMFAFSAYLARKGQIVFALIITFAAPLLLSPVVFPWYLSVLVPLAALRPSAAILAWVSAAPLGYIVLNDWLSQGIWQPPDWPLWCIASALIFGLLYDFARASKPAFNPERF
jgi:hypothetical protein